ncbi:MBL fold metallo-hydrolase [Parapedobacter tibetensis]|uniref:MBL fold metallo-hydrolase n=1 Tax=Parapedobacter tibetensis TaxID=2972951 RepID=UPI00214D4062|nr:rhodanese-like domain-containing protein [Parapedobacter tibetensis]
MLIHQFYDKGLAHASYAILSEGMMAVIDPARDPQPYLDFAKHHQGQISTILETHPHADFVSSHLELHQLTGATIYTSRLVGAEYPHQPFDDGDRIALGKVQLEAINTPGHSPDSVSILLLDEQNQPYAIFTGDTLFVGDVGRPDLRENAGNITAKAEFLAKQLYRSTREKLMSLPQHVLVYPAHGPGSLCGRNMGADLHSSIGREINENYALQDMDEGEFVALLMERQPFVPKYFEYDVRLNKKGAKALRASIDAIPSLDYPAVFEAGITIVDGRPQAQFRAGHQPGAIHIPDGLKFETWLGSILAPDERFYLVSTDREALQILVQKVAKIGYEQQIVALVVANGGPSVSAPFELEAFEHNPRDYTVIDIRDPSEVTENPVFDHSIHIPLSKLRENTQQIPVDKPIVVHCAGGYRSAIGASIIAAALPHAVVQDMGIFISDFTPAD